MPIEPLLKWAGSKRKLAPTIQRAYDCPPAKGYLEPFTGAGCVFAHRYGLDLDPSKVEVVLGDSNARLMAFYRLIRKAPEDLCSAMALLPWGEGWKSSFSDTRNFLNRWTPDAIEVADPMCAAVFLWLNRAAFNGLYRVNADGAMNAPAGSYDVLSPPGRGLILDWSKALENVALITSEYQGAIPMAGKGWQVYLDPPYLDNYSGYTSQTWDYEEQVRLAMCAAGAVEKGAHVIASNAASDRLSAVWKAAGFRVRGEKVRHSISASADGRKSASEVLFIGGEGRK